MYIYILAITYLLTYVSVLGKHVLAVHQFDSRIEMLRVPYITMINRCSTPNYLLTSLLIIPAVAILFNVLHVY